MAGLYERRVAHGIPALREQERPQPVTSMCRSPSRESRGTVHAAPEKRGKIERVGGCVARSSLTQALDVTDRLLQRAEAELREQPAHFLGNEEQIRLHHLRRSGELRAELGLLGRDPDRARVEMA